MSQWTVTLFTVDDKNKIWSVLETKSETFSAGILLESETIGSFKSRDDWFCFLHLASSEYTRVRGKLHSDLPTIKPERNLPSNPEGNFSFLSDNGTNFLCVSGLGSGRRLRSQPASTWADTKTDLGSLFHLLALQFPTWPTQAVPRHSRGHSSCEWVQPTTAPSSVRRNQPCCGAATSAHPTATRKHRLLVVTTILAVQKLLDPAPGGDADLHCSPNFAWDALWWGTMVEDVSSQITSSQNTTFSQNTLFSGGGQGNKHFFFLIQLWWC